jgi:hypothetical protein
MVVPIRPDRKILVQKRVAPLAILNFENFPPKNQLKRYRRERKRGWGREKKRKERNWGTNRVNGGGRGSENVYLAVGDFIDTINEKACHATAVHINSSDEISTGSQMQHCR